MNTKVTNVCYLAVLCLISCSRFNEFTPDGSSDDRPSSREGSSSGPLSDGAVSNVPTSVAAAPDAGEKTTGGQASTDASCGSPSDSRNCGLCGMDCNSLPHVRSDPPVECKLGQCVVMSSSCLDGFAHCSSNPSDGCETSLSRSENCGACNNVCSGALSLCASVGGRFQCVSSCGSTTPDLCGSDCTNVQSDIENCGRCGAVCDVPGAKAKCVAGACMIAACNKDRADCNGRSEDGCETDLSRKESCGGCNTACQGTTSLCTKAADSFRCTSSCVSPTPENCGSRCADLQSDAANCGRCGNVCSGPKNSQSACSQGQCVFTCLGSTRRCNDQCLPNDQVCNGQCGSGFVVCDSSCVATAQTTRTCKAMCGNGTQHCSGGSWGACSGARQPTAEVCNGIDDDCDGTADNGPNLCPAGQVCNGKTCACPANTCGSSCQKCTADQTCSNGSCKIKDGTNQSCVGDGDCASGKCVVLYPDADGDGYGDKTRSGTHFCGQRMGFVADNTDCCDVDRLVRPNASATQPTARNSACPGGAGNFDYNCDGMETPKTTGRGVMCNSPTDPCTPGWVFGAPGCGETAPFTICISGCSTITIVNECL
jgi:hypothetical protein